MRRARVGLVVVLFLLTSIVIFGAEAKAHDGCFGDAHKPYWSSGTGGTTIYFIAGVHCDSQHDRYRIVFCPRRNGNILDGSCWTADTLAGWDAKVFHNQPRTLDCQTGTWDVWVRVWRAYNNAGVVVHEGGLFGGPNLQMNSC
jgi:hypothetical protein